MSYELEGKLFVKEDTTVISDKFRKRDAVILKETNNAGQVFTDHVKFQFTQDKCDLLDAYNVGDEVKISFNIRGNKWEKNDKTSYFNNLDAWRIEKVSEPSYPQTTPNPQIGDDKKVDDLPF